MACSRLQTKAHNYVCPKTKAIKLMDTNNVNKQSDFVGANPKRSLAEAISEVDRELQVRRRCYSRWVDDGKMTEVDAIDRYDRLAAASFFLHQAKDQNDAKPVN